MFSKNTRQTGFTIVELLIVIVVIGILAAITIVAFNGVQDRARASKAHSDLAQLERAMRAANTLTGRTIVDLTASLGANSTGTGRGCWSQANGTDLAALAKTHACWTDYYATLEILTNVSGVNVNGLVDPWGRPYYIDQSEGEFTNPCQSPDRISTYRRPFVSGFANYDPAYSRTTPFVASC